MQQISNQSKNNKTMSNTTFKQRSKFNGTGNFINHMMANNSTMPEIGKGATEICHSDRYCYEVIEVSKDSKTVKLERLEASPDTTKDCQMGHQNWLLTPTGYYTTVVWRHGKWRKKLRQVDFINSKMCITDLTEEQKIAVYGNHIWPQHVVEGITKEVITYEPITLLFGQKDYYRCWEL